MSRHAPLPEPTLAEPPSRPARPWPVELAAAVLIAGGAIGILTATAGALNARTGPDPFLGLALALNTAAVVVGVVIRTGRLWVVAVNYVAVLGFLDLLVAGTSPLAFMLGVADILVVVILFVHKPWFDAVAAWRRERRAGRLSP